MNPFTHTVLKALVLHMQGCYVPEISEEC